jgi:hypothetical protein
MMHRNQILELILGMLHLKIKHYTISNSAIFRVKDKVVLGAYFKHHTCIQRSGGRVPHIFKLSVSGQFHAMVILPQGKNPGS